MSTMRLLPALAAACALAAQDQNALAEKAALAKSYAASERFDKAAQLYGEIVAAMPGNPGLLLNYGMALHMSGADAKAIPVLEKALKLNPGMPPALLFLGAAYLRTGKPALAEAPLRKFVAADPDHLGARQMLVDAATMRGRPADAMPHWEKLSQLQPRNPVVWYELGRAYEAAAFSAFAQMEKQFPESGPWFALLADSRSKTSQNRAAFFFYRRAIEKSPRMRGPRAAIAAIYRRTGHDDWAAVEEAAEQKLGAPNCAVKNPECEMRAGRIQSALALARSRPTADGFYWRIRAYDALARQAFEQLAALPPSAPGFRFQAETHRDQGRHTESVAAWREALRLDPGNPELSRELAASLMTAREFDDAQKVTAELLAAEPAAPDLNHLQGDLYLARQMAAEAVPFLEKAVAAGPNVLEARASLARALLQAGRPADALPHVTAALPLDADGSLHFQLARAYQAAGQADAAKTAMARYQAIRSKMKEQERVVEEEVQITAP